MTAAVFTTEGLVARAELEAKDVISETEASRVVATEWRRAGRLVRRDVWVNLLAPQNMQADTRK